MGRTSVVLLTALLGCGIYSVSLKAYLLNREDPAAVLRRGKAAPAFELATLDGNEMDLQQVAGENKIVLVNFWATWCQPCRLEMPLLERLYNEYHEQGLEILAISAEEPGTIEAFLAENPYTFPVLVDSDGSVSESYGIEAIPTTVLVDADGEVIRTRTGVSLMLEAEVKALMDREDAR